MSRPARCAPEREALDFPLRLEDVLDPPDEDSPRQDRRAREAQKDAMDAYFRGVPTDNLTS